MKKIIVVMVMALAMLLICYGQGKSYDYHGCYQKENGQLRILTNYSGDPNKCEPPLSGGKPKDNHKDYNNGDDGNDHDSGFTGKCRPSEILICWNETGPQGPTAQRDQQALKGQRAQQERPEQRVNKGQLESQMVSHARSTALSLGMDQYYSAQDSPPVPMTSLVTLTFVTPSFISTYHSLPPPHALSHRSHTELSSPSFFHRSQETAQSLLGAQS